MGYILRFANGGIWYLVVPAIIFVILWRLKYYKSPVYRYSLAEQLKKQRAASYHPYKIILSVIRCFVLIVLALLVLKPQLVDTSSQIKIEGIDIMLVLDLSGSMQFRDFKDDKRSRFEIAKNEAIRFIDKRDNDAVGLVLFGRDSVSRCPLTLDKHVLNEIVKELELGTIDPDGTVLSTGLVTAINRLRRSQAKSKIIILLTDGEPSEFDTDPAIAIEAATKLGIKIYTVGIGSDKQEHFIDPFHRVILKPGVNAKLLKSIAKKTGGEFFMARSSRDMREIYNTIDKLEKSETQAPVFSRFYDIGAPIAWAVFGLMLLECWLSVFIWFGI